MLKVQILMSPVNESLFQWSPFSSIQSGVYILAVSQTLLARTENPDVIEAMNEILNDLVVGEFQQLASSSQESDRSEMYIEKCYNKTASLMANSCKSVAMLANEEGLDAEIAVGIIIFDIKH